MAGNGAGYEEVSNPVFFRASKSFGVSPPDAGGDLISGQDGDKVASAGDDPVAVLMSPLRSPTKRRLVGVGATRRTSSREVDGSGHSSTGTPRLIEIDITPVASSCDSIGSHCSTSEKKMLNELLASTTEEAKAQRAATLKAMALIGFSAFIYSIQTLNVKLLGGRVDSLTITLFRGLVGAVFSTASSLASRRRTGLWGSPANRSMLLLRGLLGGVTIASAFFAVSELDLAVASTIIFTAPLWTAALAYVFDKGAWGLVDTFAALCCLTGMLLITRPPGIFADVSLPAESDRKPLSTLGILSALVSAITAAGVNLTIRRLKSEEAATITLYAMVGSIVVVLPGFIWAQASQTSGLSRADGLTLLQLCLTGFFSWLAQMSKTQGVMMSKNLGVLVMRYLDIVFSFIWDVVIIHAPVDPYGVGGASVIVGGCIFSIIMKGQG